MAGISNIDIMGSLNDALSAIMSSKIDLSLPTAAPFAEQAQRMKENQELIEELQDRISAERSRVKALAIQQKASGGVGTDIRAPARIRNRI